MTRSFLQFAGGASTMVWSALLVGTLSMSSARAQYTMGDSSCTDCYSCTADKSSCTYVGTGRNCTGDNATCNCNPNDGTPICSKVP